MSEIKLYNGDCLEKMKDIPEKSVDMILCDLPYGTTACKWDTVIPFNRHIKEINNRGKEIILYRDEYILQEVKKGKSYKDTINYFDNNAIDGLWDNYKRIIKDNGAIVLFGSHPFTSALVMSNPKMFKYEWIWDKHIPRNFINAKIMPMQKHENILIFGKGKINYYPQMIERDKPVKVKNYSKGNSAYKLNNNGTDDKERIYTHRHPDTIIEGKWEANAGKLHPTQKPVALCEYLIKTYTNEGETVLDNCMGSGTTGVACVNTKRNFIGIEKDEHYFQVAKDRIENHIIPLDKI